MNELSLFNSLFDNGISDVMSDFNFGYSFNTPRMDMKESKNAYILEMDLPGRTEKDVNVELDHNVLTISSHHEETEEKAPEKDTKNRQKDETKWLFRERRMSDFCRRLTLPNDVDGTDVSASFRNGVLMVNVPRKALASPKRIAITAA
jgi:HSP20 family protein